MLVAQIQDLIL